MRNLLVVTLFLAACGGSSTPTPPADKPEAGKPADLPPAAPPVPVAAAPEAAPAVAGDPMVEGEKVYSQYCIACHQADGKGMNSTLAGDFTSGRLGEKSDEELLTSIREGFTGKIGAMPAWKGVLTDDQMKAVLGYVKEKYHPKG